MSRLWLPVVVACVLLVGCGDDGGDDRPMPPPGSPNVVLILADDLGWIDTATTGSGYYVTPQTDRLAARGVRVQTAYSPSPLCTPSRAAILTGLLPHRLGITLAEGHLPEEPGRPAFDPAPEAWMKVITPLTKRWLPEGNWTIASAFGERGYDTCLIGKWHLGSGASGPRANGFDRVVGGSAQAGPGSFCSPYGVGNLPDGPAGEYLTDRLAKEAAAWIGAKRRRPFMLCLWHYAVHAPYEALAGDRTPYIGRTDLRGYQSSPTMGGMVAAFDRSIGTVLDALAASGHADDTIVVLTSDNGGNMYDAIDGTTPTSNAPLRSGKGNAYEGGVRVPFIIAGPGLPRGTVCPVVADGIDLLPTLLGLSRLGVPTGRPLDGRDLGPALAGGEAGQVDHYWHFPHYVPATGNRPASAIRRERWKLYRFYGEGASGGDRLELYDLQADPGESTDQAAAQPALVAELSAALSAHLAATGARIPYTNPGYDPGAASPMPPMGAN